MSRDSAGDDRGLAACQNCSPAEFGALFTASYRSLRLIAFGVVQDSALAEDVIQDAALIALTKIQEFRPGSSFCAWMSRIVHFVARNQARTRSRRRTLTLGHAVAQAAPTEGSPATDAAEFLAGGQLSADQQHFDDQLIAALRRAAPTPRTCLLLRAVEGLAYSEIARRLCIPVGTVMSHVHRTRRLLRRELARSSPATPADRADAVDTKNTPWCSLGWECRTEAAQEHG